MTAKSENSATAKKMFDYLSKESYTPEDEKKYLAEQLGVKATEKPDIWTLPPTQQLQSGADDASSSSLNVPYFSNYLLPQARFLPFRGWLLRCLVFTEVDALYPSSKAHNPALGPSSLGPSFSPSPLSPAPLPPSLLFLLPLSSPCIPPSSALGCTAALHTRRATRRHALHGGGTSARRAL